MSASRRFQHVALLMFSIGALLAVLFAILFAWSNRPPSISVPVRLCPQPNGWDDIVRAAIMVREIGYDGPASDYPRRQWKVPELQRFVDANKPALDLLREGLAKQYLHPPTRTSKAAEERQRDYTRVRELGRTLVGEAEYYKALGDPEKQAGCLLDCMELGVSLPNGGFHITGLMGRAIEAIAHKQFDAVIYQLDAEALARVADRMEKIQRKRTSFSEIALEDGRVDTALHVEAFRSSAFRKSIANPINWFLGSRLNAGAEGITPADVWFNARVTFANKRAAVQDYEVYYKALAAEQRGPYTGSSRVPVPNNIILQSASDANVARRRSPFTYNEAVFLLLQTQVALERYRKDFGSYPEMLERLVPKYLDAVPMDPFGSGKPLRYRLLKGGGDFVLYGIGGDLRDDKGKAVKWEGHKTKGDLVARHLW